MVATAEFNDAYDRLVAGPVLASGGWQEGRRVFWRRDGVTAALLRTELRYLPPVEITMVVRHDMLRDMREQVPRRPPTNPSSYPIKLAPSAAPSLCDPAWRYQPYNYGRFPSDTVPYPELTAAGLDALLAGIGDAVAAVLPGLVDCLPPARLAERLAADGEDAWCERMWLEDLHSHGTGAR